MSQDCGRQVERRAPQGGEGAGAGGAAAGQGEVRSEVKTPDRHAQAVLDEVEAEAAAAEEAAEGARVEAEQARAHRGQGNARSTRRRSCVTLLAGGSAAAEADELP